MPVNLKIQRPGNVQPTRSISATYNFADKQVNRESRRNQTTPAVVAGVNNTTGKVIVKRPGSNQSYPSSADSSRLTPTPGKGLLAQRSHSNQGRRSLTVTDSSKQPGSVRVSASVTTSGGLTEEQQISKGCRQPSSGAPPPPLDCSGEVGSWFISYTAHDPANFSFVSGNRQLKGNHEKQPILDQKEGFADVYTLDKEGKNELDRVTITGQLEIKATTFVFNQSHPCYSSISPLKRPGGDANWLDGGFVR